VATGCLTLALCQLVEQIGGPVSRGGVLNVVERPAMSLVGAGDLWMSFRDGPDQGHSGLKQPGDGAVNFIMLGAQPCAVFASCARVRFGCRRPKLKYNAARRAVEYDFVLARRARRERREQRSAGEKGIL
jgi:hypothetical protein